MSKFKLFTFLLIFLSFSAIFSFYNFDSASAQGVTWTYNADTNTATASGSGSTNFAELVQSDIDGGWGVATADATGTIIYITCKLVIGDGTNTLTLEDKSKVVNIILNLGGVATGVSIASKATVTLGVLDDAADKTTSHGCLIRYISTDNSRLQISGSGTLILYGCTLNGDTTYAWNGLSLYQITTLKMYNCICSHVVIQETGSGCYFYNVQLQRAPFGAILFVSTAALTEKISITDSAQSGLWSYAPATFLNCIVRNSASKTFTMNCWVASDAVNVVNADVDSWTITWNTANGKLYRQYTFNLNVLNGNITDFVANATVQLWKDSALVYEGVTNSSGMIPTQTLTYGYYQQSTGDIIQNATSPYYLVISHPDWQTYVSRFYITQPLRLTVSMQEPTYTGYTEAEKSDYTTIILFVISLILCIIGLAIIVPLLPLISLTISVINIIFLSEPTIFNILLIVLNVTFTLIALVRAKTKNN